MNLKSRKLKRKNYRKIKTKEKRKATAIFIVSSFFALHSDSVSYASEVPRKNSFFKEIKEEKYNLKNYNNLNNAKSNIDKVKKDFINKKNQDYSLKLKAKIENHESQNKDIIQNEKKINTIDNNQDISFERPVIDSFSTKYSDIKKNNNNIKIDNNIKDITSINKTRTSDNISKVIVNNDINQSSENIKNNNFAKKSLNNKKINNKSQVILSSAYRQLGIAQDCTTLVSKSLASIGIYFQGWPADYLQLGKIINHKAAQPGDLIYYNNAGAGVPHIAIYIGGNQAIHGGWMGGNTVINSVYIGEPIFIKIT